MPRPKNIKIPPEQAVIYQSVLDYLKSNSDIVIERLKRFVHINGNKVVGKKEICRIMKISRPTLDKWIDWRSDVSLEYALKKRERLNTY